MLYHPNDILLDKYHLEATIGEGAFAQVYRATHLKLKGLRALKVLRRDAPGIGSTEFGDYRQRFELEAQLGERIDHPNVIRVYDFEQDEDQLILVMEYAPGGSLADRLERARQKGELISVDEAVRIAVDVAQGLSTLHALEAVHRDLKPSNILFDAQGRAKLADLGLAQVPGGFSKRSQMGSQAVSHPGTPAYMSPEQERSKDYLKPASDVYALGLVLFEMLTLRSYKNQPPGMRTRALRQDVPKWLDELLVRMLATNPAARPWDGQAVEGELALGLKQLKRRQPSKPSGLEPSAEPSRWWQRWQVWVGGGLLVLLALVLVLIFPPGFIPTHKNPVATEEATAPALILTSFPETTTPSPEPTSTPTATYTPTLTPTETPAPTTTLTPTPTYTPKAGATWISPVDGMVMVYVPAGEFLMGSADSDLDAYDNEKPQHRVYLDSFWIDRTEVTNAMYFQCEQSGECRPPFSTESFSHPKYYDDSRFKNYPVFYVSWVDAKTYCEWAGRQLPSEAQWEKAARWDPQAGRARKFPWGDAVGCFYENYYYCDWDTTEVGSHPAGASLYGVLGMAGSVSEWVADWYSEYYYATYPDGEWPANPLGPSSGSERVLRGGWWADMTRDVRAATRNRSSPDGNSGFRCARSP